LNDVLESFVAVRAGVNDVTPFLTHLDQIAMWLSPLIGLSTREEGWTKLREGEFFDLVLEVPGRPRFRCQVLPGEPDDSLPSQPEIQTIRVAFKGFATGVSTWQVVPARAGTIVQHRIAYSLENRWTAIPWALAGRWAAILHMGWQMRRLKGRIEDTVGSSEFGVPLVVSPFALAAVSFALVLFLGRCLCKLGRMVRSRKKP